MEPRHSRSPPHRAGRVERSKGRVANAARYAAPIARHTAHAPVRQAARNLDRICASLVLPLSLLVCSGKAFYPTPNPLLADPASHKYSYSRSNESHIVLYGWHVFCIIAHYIFLFNLFSCFRLREFSFLSHRLCSLQRYVNVL